jgi:hypothetical protein
VDWERLPWRTAVVRPAGVEISFDNSELRWDWVMGWALHVMPSFTNTYKLFKA